MTTGLMAGGNSIHDNVVNAQNITLVLILSRSAVKLPTKHAWCASSSQSTYNIVIDRAVGSSPPVAILILNSNFCTIIIL